ncbi:MAG TPA: hypothetical protein VGB87_09965 [Vicinamibacteria bacterium]
MELSAFQGCKSPSRQRVTRPGAGPGVEPRARSPLALSRRLWRSPLLPPLAVFLVSLAGALRSGLRWTDGRLVYALDDAYIHMAVARNLASHGIWGCTPYHFSSSSSSLLWTFGLGVAYRAFGSHDVIPLLLNVAFAVGTLVVANVSLARLGASPLLRASALLGIVVVFPLAGMALIGMEHVLHLLLTIGFAAVAVEALQDPSEDPRRRRRFTVALGVLGALLAASRYEGLFLVGLACLGFLVRGQRLRAVSTGVAALLPSAAFGAISVANGWYFLPNPLMVKAVDERSSTLTALLKPFGSEDLAFLRNNRAMPILLALSALGALARWRAGGRVARPPVLFPRLLAGMILLHGHFVFSPLYWAYRYDAYLVAFGLFVAAVVSAEMPAPRTFPRGALPALLVAALAPVVADVREGLVPDAETEGMRRTYLMHYQTAQFIRRYHPRDAVIVNDLGAVTYFTEARILDLVGLGDIEPLRIMRRGAYTSDDVAAWTAPFRPKVAILQLDWSVVSPLVPPRWVRVAVVEVPPTRHRVGVFAVDPNEIWTLRASVAQHFGPLSRDLGYRLKLRSPEEVAAAYETSSRPGKK